ncbi:hypothetical protein [Nocardia sp. NPDC005366]|uniref:hypothetical protein n=1 Tax=Nocardia sp. NPDC005366 TaxID=3156878 RepID=UPI0033B4F851
MDESFESVIEQYANAATVSVGLAHAMLDRHLEVDLAQALTNESTFEKISTRSADFKEGIASLRERRESEYRGL